jgi:hypothetical protein
MLYWGYSLLNGAGTWRLLMHQTIGMRHKKAHLYCKNVIRVCNKFLLHKRLRRVFPNSWSKWGCFHTSNVTHHKGLWKTSLNEVGVKFLFNSNLFSFDSFASLHPLKLLRPSVCTDETFQETTNGFYEILYWRILRITIQSFELPYRLDNFNVHFAWRPICLSGLISGLICWIL